MAHANGVNGLKSDQHTSKSIFISQRDVISTQQRGRKMLEHLFREPTIAGAAFFDAPPSNPMTIFREWWNGAVSAHVIEPGAMALATADEDGFASNRIVQLLGFQDGELLFTTHANSRKGRELAVTPWAAGALYWRETKQQIVFAGPVAAASAKESDRLWARRPLETNAVSFASQQSEGLDSEAALREEAHRHIHAATPLPRPERWAAYVLTPRYIEFWASALDKIHRRLRYDAHSDGWTCRRLQP